jgi:hypothetical protein
MNVVIFNSFLLWRWGWIYQDIWLKPWILFVDLRNLCH